MPFELTRDEMIRARETRAIPRHTFSKNFGGTWKSEWPGCTRIPGYKNFLCVDINAQPFAPTAPGKPGLIFRFPTTVPTPLDDGDTFHLFLVRGGLLHYQGDYVRPRLRVEVEFNHWNDLSHDVSVQSLSACQLILSVVLVAVQAYLAETYDQQSREWKFMSCSPSTHHPKKQTQAGAPLH